MIRPCTVCLTEDGLPRHVLAVMNPAPGEETQYRHIECCAATGCQVCIETLQGATNA